jgi:RNA polymerase sigma-70 factor (ECF subfamily)
MENKEDIEWISQLRSGNVYAFNSIYERYHHALYRNIFKITKDPQVSEDILQEVFIALWEHRRELKKQKSLGGWLFVTSFNKSINYIKKELNRSKEKNKMSLHYAGKSDTESPADHYDQQYGLLQNAIAQLSPQKQKTFVLCKLEGKTYNEAAKTLKISKYTIKEYLSSAMTIIKDYIKHHPQYLNSIDKDA